MQKKKIPIRRCVGCRESKPKRELVRVVRDPEGNISVDVTGKKSGRGAYVCKAEKCLAAAKKQKSLERALECAIGEEVYDRLAAEIAEAEPPEDE